MNSRFCADMFPLHCFASLCYLLLLLNRAQVTYSSSVQLICLPTLLLSTLLNLFFTFHCPYPSIDQPALSTLSLHPISLSLSHHQLPLPPTYPPTPLLHSSITKNSNCSTSCRSQQTSCRNPELPVGSPADILQKPANSVAKHLNVVDFCGMMFWILWNLSQPSRPFPSFLSLRTTPARSNPNKKQNHNNSNHLSKNTKTMFFSAEVAQIHASHITRSNGIISRSLHSHHCIIEIRLVRLGFTRVSLFCWLSVHYCKVSQFPLPCMHLVGSSIVAIMLQLLELPISNFINPVFRNKLGSDGAVCTSTSSCRNFHLVSWHKSARAQSNFYLF